MRLLPNQPRSHDSNSDLFHTLLPQKDDHNVISTHQARERRSPSAGIPAPGNRARTTVPLPGSLSISRLPLSLVMRSLIVRKPRCPGKSAAGPKALAAIADLDLDPCRYDAVWCHTSHVLNQVHLGAVSFAGARGTHDAVCSSRVGPGQKRATSPKQVRWPAACLSGAR